LPHDANSNYGTAINQWRGPVPPRPRIRLLQSDFDHRTFDYPPIASVEHRRRRHSPRRSRTRLKHRLPLQWPQNASYDVWGQLAWIVRKVSEVDITESDRALGAYPVACSLAAWLEHIGGRLGQHETCDDAPCAAIPIWSIFVATSVIVTMHRLSPQHATA
jgi:hypothetical protein